MPKITEVLLLLEGATPSGLGRTRPKQNCHSEVEKDREHEDDVTYQTPKHLLGTTQDHTEKYLVGRMNLW